MPQEVTMAFSEGVKCATHNFFFQSSLYFSYCLFTTYIRAYPHLCDCLNWL